jgi:hypothetical protein
MKLGQIKFLITLPLAFILESNVVSAQKNITHQDIYWYRLAATYKTTESISVYLEGEQRRFLGNMDVVNESAGSANFSACKISKSL